MRKHLEKLNIWLEGNISTKKIFLIMSVNAIKISWRKFWKVTKSASGARKNFA